MRTAVRFLISSLAISLVFALAISAQENTETPVPNQPEKIAQVKPDKEETDKLKTDDKTVTAPENTDDATEEKEVLSFYNNYLKEYRLGANDVISVEVFGQCPDYCVVNKTVPPTAKISYPLIRDGVFVGGKTVEEVAAEITKQLDEYIIDPKVSVTLEKAMSARYSVMGKVVSPGIRIMDRKVSLYEAINEAGGVAKDGESKKVAILRFNEQGTLDRQDIDLTAIEKGKAPMVFLNPGDQVIVPKKGFTLSFSTVFDVLQKASIVRLLFGSPF
jgi:protein involved in polysaccharide export with SLBB domain